ncbi:hydroxyisourate hydrolase [Candidatus Pelagibacter sp.]|jgi:5-hydroxyisourate hydrolase|nr:hydroxyisourate hydrolase [Candidatus Pelagibacter sp.]|tara:strand:- start:204 stop:539 length:336 start_codon:yes stop_codon:yes gene_type:complete
MATLSSHLLNSVDGTHASGVKVIIHQINSSGDKVIFFETETDDGGRILKDFELSNDDCNCDYEMIYKTADYFSEKKIVSEITIKFRMENPKKKYHLPIIISPNGYSIWWSQ